MAGHTMRCLSSSLLPSNCSDITATSKLAPHLQGKGWPTQSFSGKNYCVRTPKRYLSVCTACTKHSKGEAEESVPARCVHHCLHADEDEGSEKPARV